MCVFFFHYSYFMYPSLLNGREGNCEKCGTDRKLWRWDEDRALKAVDKGELHPLTTSSWFSSPYSFPSRPPALRFLSIPSSGSRTAVSVWLIIVFHGYWSLATGLRPSGGKRCRPYPEMATMARDDSRMRGVE